VKKTGLRANVSVLVRSPFVLPITMVLPVAFDGWAASSAITMVMVLFFRSIANDGAFMLFPLQLSFLSLCPLSLGIAFLRL
jgi:hypothetical protein